MTLVTTNFHDGEGMSLPAETVAITADKAVDCGSLSDFDAFGYLRRAAENVIKRTWKAPARFSLANPLDGGAADGSRVGFRASFGLRR